MEEKATQQALSAGAHPLVLALAQKMLGKKEYVGYCQSFVRKMGGTTGGASAIQAWQNAQGRVQGTQGIQPGDLVYFSPNQSNRGFGHTGIYAGNNEFISATNSGILKSDLNKWQASTAQKLLGYVPQGARQPQEIRPQNQQIPNQPAQKIVTPRLTPLPVPQASAPIAMPNPLREEDTTTYGRITVPNL